MLNNVNHLISKQLKALMEKRKLKDSDVLRLCGFTRPTLNKIQNNGNITIETLASLANGLKVPVGYFFDESASTTITTTGDYSPASDSGDITLNVGAPVLTERIKAMEALIKEKDERLKEKDERISDLRDLLNMKKCDQ